MDLKIEKHIGLFLFLVSVIFVFVFKFNSLNDPFFWDALGVYANGIYYLVENGISILPNAMPPDLSRGHPLLFYVMHAFVLKIFGSQLFISHFFSLLLSCFLLFLLYKSGKKLLGDFWGGICVVLFAVQPIFLAQSSLILPEISVSIIILLAFLLATQKKWLGVVLVLSIGVWIKESVLPFTGLFFLFYLSDTFKKNTSKNIFKKSLLFALPICAFLIFIGIQKLQHGWFFFPYHLNIAEGSALKNFSNHIKGHYNFVFLKQGRNQWMIFIALGFFISLLKRKTLPIFIKYSSILVLFSFLLFGFAFYMDRYLLFIYPFLVLVIVWGIKQLAKKPNIIALLSIAFLIFSSCSSYSKKHFRYDVNLNYRDVLEVQTSCTHYLEKLNKKEKLNVYSNFPIVYGLINPNFGFYNNPNSLIPLTHSLNKNPEIVALYNSLPPDSISFMELKVFQKNDAKIIIYKRLNEE